MNFAFYIARRYLFSKKSHNAVNIISIVSVCGVVVATAALVCALSVQNGFSGLIISMFDKFDPELKILPAEGKVFDPGSPDILKVKALPDVMVFSETLQDNALIRYHDRQVIATVKGVDSAYTRMGGIDSVIVDGQFVLRDEIVDYATIGAGVSASLGAKPGFAAPLEICVPKRDGNINVMNPASSANIEYAYVGGVFLINQPSYDEGYLIVPIELSRSLFLYEKEVSAIELKLSEGVSVASVQKNIQDILGRKYKVQDRFQQQETSFKMMQIEKWVTFLILIFILTIALFNVVGSLSMLMIEKRADVRTLRNMGANDRLINRIFLFEGWMISGFGALIGIFLGFVLCMLQQTFHLISLGDTSGVFIVDDYPVRVMATDLLAVFATVGTIGFLAAWYPVHYLGKKWFDS